MNARPYDVVAFGATSFVGKLLCHYFASHFKSGELKWVAAGRSIEKLELMRRSLDKTDAEIPLIIADARDERSLAAMCAQTGVVVSTIGPYAVHGEPLVAVCAELGTDYRDLSGEVQWIRRMLDCYEKTARLVSVAKGKIVRQNRHFQWFWRQVLLANARRNVSHLRDDSPPH